MSLHFFAVSLRKDAARLLRDPSQLTVALGIPVVLAVLMSLVFGRQPAAPHGLLLVADEDQTTASDHLLDAFRSTELSKMVRLEKVSRDAGRARIDRGDASAFLIIPKGLQQAFFLRQPLQLELFTNPSQSILPAMIEESLSLTVDGAFYLRRVMSTQSLDIRSGELPPEITRYFKPPLIGLATESVRSKAPPRSFASIFLPSMLFMGMLFLANGTAADIWRERMAGTLRRLAASPVSMAAYLASRVLFVALLYVVVSFGGLLAARQLAGMPVPNLAAAALWVTFTGTVFYLLFLAIAVQASTQRGASVLANLIIFPLAMLGGCFFPFAWMPGWMVAIGRLTPNGWALTTFQSILAGTGNAARLAVSTATLAAFAAIAFVLALRRLRSSFAL